MSSNDLKIAIVGVLFGCRVGYDDVVTRVTVEPVYPQHASWSAYVAHSDIGADRNHQADVECDPMLPLGPASCVHGGEKRMVVLDSVDSCKGLTAEDSLGAFDWTCDDSDGVAFFSRGLRSTARLADLLDSSAVAFRPNRIVVKRNGVMIAYSDYAVWWDNPVRELPTTTTGAMIDLQDAGSIYMVVGNRTAAGVTLADHTALVVMPDGLLEMDGSGALTCNTATGSASAPDARCLVIADNRKFVWLEGRFQGAPLSSTGIPLHAVSIASSRFAVVRKVELSQCQSNCVRLLHTQNSRIEWIMEHSSAGHGIHLEGSSFNRIVHVRAANNAADGIRLDGLAGSPTVADSSSHVVLADVVTYSNGGDGVSILYATHNVLVGIVAAYSRSGIYVIVGNHVINHVTSIGCAAHGINLDRKNGGHSVSNVVAIANAMNGFNDSDTTVASPASYHNVVVTNNGAYGINDVTVAPTSIRGVLMVGNNASGNCMHSGYGVGSVLSNTCSVSGSDGSMSYVPTSSSAVLRTNRSALASLVGRIQNDDTTNPADALGVGGPVTNWLDFDTPYRVWGPEAQGTAGRCVGTCRIVDVRLRATDETLRDHTANGEAANDPFVAGASCPSTVASDQFLEDLVQLEVRDDAVGNNDGICNGGEACYDPDRFLINAVEILDDDVGDDDGLCESREACIYAPNFGAYQGEGNYRDAECVLQSGDGPINSVRMFGYPINGAP